MSKCINVKYEGKPLYNIVIEQSFDKLAEEFDKLGITGRKLCIVSDSNVAPLYAKYVEDQLSKTGNKIFTYVFEAGEANKNLDTVEDVYEFLIKNHFDRKDMLVALGGGVVGDLTGFTAATYLRGISFIQVPTSLLAQVDSSIGGKTGVDFRAYKNMVGAFYQPKLVYMNISVLKSLSDRLFNSGFGEIIKHGLIKDAAYYEWLRDNISNIKSRNSDALEQMIYVSCNIKREVVEKDPKEKGDRALLNYGHTLGHAIEKLMNFKLYHGECVTLGMIAALRISVNRGDIDEKAYNDAIDMFKLYDFPLNVTGITAEDVVKVSKSDKKMDAGKIKFILLKEIGNAYIDYDVTDEEMLAALKDVILCNR
jgi:3-dehydroquinate synthase